MYLGYRRFFSMNILVRKKGKHLNVRQTTNASLTTELENMYLRWCGGINPYTLMGLYGPHHQR